MVSPFIDWREIIKKEAIDIGGEELGEVQDISNGTILLEKGLLNKKKYCIPVELIKDYDGEILLLGITEKDASSKFQVY